MIASILKLNRQDIKALGRNVDEYSYHKLVYTLFPGNERDFLYVDQGGRYGERSILVLSKRHPVEPEIGEVYTKQVPENFLSYNFYAFEVRLNPVKRKDRAATAVTGREELAKWFLSRQEQWGFEADPDRLEIINTGIQQFRKGDSVITHNAATFRGILKVTEKDSFSHSFTKGLGRGKAFGFGLLQLQPVHQ
jgi:CRISPR system Cascade subunit CasE